MLAEVAERRAGLEQLTRRLRNDDLPAVPRGHDPRRPMDVDPDVALVRDPRLAGMDAHSHPNRAFREHGLRLRGARRRVAGPLEGDEERVALSVHLDPAVTLERVAQDATVLRQDPRVAIAQLVEQACRALDVGEQERDGSPRKLRHGHSELLKRAEV